MHVSMMGDAMCDLGVKFDLEWGHTMILNWLELVLPFSVSRIKSCYFCGFLAGRIDMHQLQQLNQLAYQLHAATSHPPPGYGRPHSSPGKLIYIKYIQSKQL